MNKLFNFLTENTKTEVAAAEKEAVEKARKKAAADTSSESDDTGDMTALMRERECNERVQTYVKHLYAQGQFRDAPASYKMQTAYNFKARVDAIRNNEDLKNPEQVAAAIKAAYEQTLLEFQECWKKAVKEEREKLAAAAVQPEQAEPEFLKEPEEEMEPEF